MKYVLILSVLLFIFQNQIAFGQPENHERITEKIAIESLERIIIHSLRKTLDRQYEEAITDPARLILLLGMIDNDPARQLLLDLLEIYFGSATGEALSHAVVKQGKTIRGSLKALISSPVRCSLLKKYPSKKHIDQIRCKEIKNRNSRVQGLIDRIDIGTAPQYVP